MAISHSLFIRLTPMLMLGLLAVLTSCRSPVPEPVEPASAPEQRRPQQEELVPDEDVARQIAQVRPSVDQFVRALNQHNPDEIAAGFLEIGVLEPQTGQPVRGRKAIADYYRSATTPSDRVRVTVQKSVVGWDRATVRATLLTVGGGSANTSFPPRVQAEFFLRRSAPTDWHIERLVLREAKDDDRGRRPREPY